MTVRGFFLLCEMLESSKVKMKMTEETLKYIVEVGFSPKFNLLSFFHIENETLPAKIDGIEIEIDQTCINKVVEFIPTYSPRIGDGFEIKLQ